MIILYAESADLDEELGVECAEGRVERSSLIDALLIDAPMGLVTTYRDRRINMVLGSRTVRCEKSCDLERGETGIAHASEDLVCGIGRLRNGKIGGNAGDVGASSQELEPRTTTAVGDTDSASKLDATGHVSTKRSRYGYPTYKSAKETV